MKTILLHRHLPRLRASARHLLSILLALPLTVHAAQLAPSDGGDLFGIAAGLSGNAAVVGAQNTTVDEVINAGAAYLFRNLDTASGTVTQNAKLTASDGGMNAFFGQSVSLFGNTALIGSFVNNYPQKGAAYLFRNLDTASGTITENAKLTASDAGRSDRLGSAVSLSGNTAVVGAVGDDTESGSAYVFRGLDTATGTVTQNAKLIASDRAESDQFGQSVSLSGSTALVGAWGDASQSGSAYLFRGLDTATGTITENAKLTASDGETNDRFGYSVSLSGNAALVGADGDDDKGSYAGAAYLFRNLDTASGTITQDVKLTASDATGGEAFGYAVSLSGNTALIGAHFDDGKASYSGSAYIFHNLDTASGTATESLRVVASDGIYDARLGYSVSLDGDQFVIGAKSLNKSYTGSVSSMSVLDAGNASRLINGLSFESREDWIIGQNTSHNTVTLSAGDTAEVTATGKAVFIGQNAGSDHNELAINGSLTANSVQVGAAGNEGNTLLLNGSLTATTIVVEAGAVFENHGTVDASVTLAEGGLFLGDLAVLSGRSVGGGGTLDGNLLLSSGARITLDLTLPLTVTGSVTLDSSFSIADVVGLDASIADGSYTLIDGTTTDFSLLNIQNWGVENKYELGENKYAYFRQGSLVLEVIPEPNTTALLLLAGGAILLRGRRERSKVENQ